MIILKVAREQAGIVINMGSSKNIQDDRKDLSGSHVQECQDFE